MSNIRLQYRGLDVRTFTWKADGKKWTLRGISPDDIVLVDETQDTYLKGTGSFETVEGAPEAAKTVTFDYEDADALENEIDEVVSDVAAIWGGITGTLADQEDLLAALDAKQTESIILAASDETTDLTTGSAKITFRMPYGFTLTAVRASVTTAPTGAALTVDINEGGVSILSTKLTIDVSEKTSTTATTPAVISDAALADDAEITVDIDQIGSSVAGAGLKVYLIGTQS